MEREQANRIQSVVAVILLRLGPWLGILVEDGMEGMNFFLFRTVHSSKNVQ